MENLCIYLVILGVGLWITGIFIFVLASLIEKLTTKKLICYNKYVEAALTFSYGLGVFFVCLGLFLLLFCFIK